MKHGDTAFIIESNRLIREVEIIRYSGGFHLIRFKDSGGEIQVRKNKLFPTREEAEENMLQHSQKQYSVEPLFMVTRKNTVATNYFL